MNKISMSQTCLYNIFYKKKFTGFLQPVATEGILNLLVVCSAWPLCKTTQITVMMPVEISSKIPTPVTTPTRQQNDNIINKRS